MNVNPNDTVWVKLRPAAFKAFRKNHDDLIASLPKGTKWPWRYSKPKLVKGWYRTQLWNLMADLGPQLSIGGDILFDSLTNKDPNVKNI